MKVCFSRVTVHRHAVEAIALERTQGGAARTRAEVCVEASETVHASRLLVESPDVETDTRPDAPAAQEWPTVASERAVSSRVLQPLTLEA